MITKNTLLDALLMPFLLLLALSLLAGALFEGAVDSLLVWDWLEAEGWALLRWWFAVSCTGLAAFPILYRLVPGLPSRGYALARAAGLMLTGFIFWLLASLGFFANMPGSIITAWLLVLLLAGMVWFRRGADTLPLREWFAAHWGLVLTVELLFAALFLGWAMYRAHVPEISSTEKPMEMMFINSIRQSPSFPPNDGWLAGYAISYYYFGYVIAAGLADVTAVNSGLAFGMMSALLFALAGIGILGLVYDLVRARDLLGRWRGGSSSAGLAAGLLGTVCLIFMGNLATPLVELPWNGQGPLKPSAEYFEFWGVDERSNLALNVATPDAALPQWYLVREERLLNPGDPLPDGYVRVTDSNQNAIADFSEGEAQLDRPFPNWAHWWWFRYSRVVTDRFLDGRAIGTQPITEFPHFSFILSDIHPHVMALPFALLAIGLAAGIVLSGRRVEWWGMGLLAVWVGGMIFMNSWDAVFIPFLVGAEALRRLIVNGTGRLSARDWWGVLGFGLLLLLLTLLFYLPWLLSFTSQAGGLYFNLMWNTAPQQLFLQFGGFLLLLLPFLLLDALRYARAVNWLGVLLAFSLLLGLLVIALPFVATQGYDLLCGDGNLSPIQQEGGAVVEPSGWKVAACNARNVLLGGLDPGQSGDFWRDLLLRRMSSYFSQGLIVLGLAYILLRLFWRPQADAPRPPYHPATGFALLSLAAGLVLILLPDFVYLRDNFAVRINTVFKFYYQGWIFLSVVAGYAAYYVLAGGLAPVGEPAAAETESPPAAASLGTMLARALYAGLLLLVLGAGLLYPYYAGRGRALHESGRYAERQRYELCLEQQLGESAGCEGESALTLDGRPSMIDPLEYQTIACFMNLNPPPGTVIAEAPFNGGYRPQYGRVSTLTGVPTLLGWINHEGQWRGDSFPQVTETTYDSSGRVLDNREQRVDRFYRSDNLEIAQSVIDFYSIDYVMVGGAERARYADSPEGLEKFEYWLTPVCHTENATIYKVN